MAQYNAILHSKGVSADSIALALKGRGDLYHYFHKGAVRINGAVDSYSQLYLLGKTHKSSEYISAATAELAGLIMEQGRSGIGNLSEVRDLLSRIQKSGIVEKNSRADITISLMRSETYFYQGRYDDCLSAISNWIGVAKKFPREYSMALWFSGLSCERAGRLADAETFFEQLSNLKVPHDERWWFKGMVWNLPLRAVQMLQHCAEKKGDYNAAVSFKNQFENEKAQLGIQSNQF